MTQGNRGWTKPAREIRNITLLRKQLCSLARYPVDYKGRRLTHSRTGKQRWKLELTACVECESPCGYGTEVLRRMSIHDLLELSCGADCTQCQEGCRLYQIVRQKIAADELERVTRERRAKKLAHQAFGLAQPPRT